MPCDICISGVANHIYLYCIACIGIADIVIQADPGINNAMVIGCELDKSVSHRVSAVGFG